MSVKFLVDNPCALMDDVITVRVSGLSSQQKVTIRAVLTDREVVLFSYACFTADGNGTVDLSACPSEAGTYEGISPMGLFWSMEPEPGQPAGIHLRSHNATLPFVYSLKVYPGHLNLKEQWNFEAPELCSMTLSRWYMAKGVYRSVVRSGRIRGALFLPPGQGPFPGIIDLFGGVGSLVDFRAALLASRGFAVLSLAYYVYDDLPTRFRDLKLEYFMEAIDWFSNHKFVASDNLGVLGQSKGGEIALQMAYYSPKIKAVVSVSGAPFMTMTPMIYKDEFIGESEYRRENFDFTEEGVSFKRSYFCNPDKFVPLWEKDVHVLLIAGGDDQCLDPAFLQQYHQQFPPESKHKCTLLFYEGAGHLIDPPYSPMFRRTKRILRGIKRPGIKDKVFVLWGGEKTRHAHAQVDSWRQILVHFRKHLQPCNHKDGTSKL